MAAESGTGHDTAGWVGLQRPTRIAHAPADRVTEAAPAPWVKLPCNCCAEWSGDEWRISASAFTCDHKQGDHVDGAPPGRG